MNIIPGEPVPPGFEDEVNRAPQIQQAIDQYKGNALLGLEYTLELHEEDRREPVYFCVLCDKRGDPRTIMQHWTSFNHRMKYLEKHYPSACREFNPVKYKPNSHNIMIIIVQSLAEAIEDHHGRLSLTVYNADDFRRSKTKICTEINAKFHFDERNGPNFLNIIDRTLWEPQPPKKMDQTLQITIKAPKHPKNDDASVNPTRDSLDEISSDEDNHDATKKPKKREQSPAFRILPRVRRSPPFEEDRVNESEKKLPTPKELSLQASHIAQERYKWEKYRCMLEIQLKQMEKIQQDYEKNPEKHPLYPEEWKKFWNRRYKELQAEKKIDPNKYDYKPEWIIFWTKRMKDLFNVEVEKKKKEIKVKLGLPEDAEEKIDQLKEKYKVQVSRNAAGVSSSHGLGSKLIERIRESPTPGKHYSREKTADVINISDDDSPRRRRRSRSRSNSPRSRRDYKRYRDATRSRSRSLSLSDEYEPQQHHHHHRRHDTRGAPPPPPSRIVYPQSAVEMDYYGALPPPAFSRSRYLPPGSSSHYGAPTAHYRVMDSHSYPKYERSPTPNSKVSTAKEDPEPEDNGPLTVVAVLRLLTALEEHLGSLGPKVVDLLGKALSLEKVKANSADDMLMNEDHCVFFETIKEKLKGILIADVLDDQQKVRAVKRAIKNIAAIVHQVDTKGNKPDNKEDDNQTNNGDLKKKSNIANLKDLPFDRQVVATKLAAALVMQGREDVSTEDMDKLIFLFVLMVRLSKEKYEADGKHLRVKDILPTLGIVVPISPSVTQFASLPAIVDELFENEVSALVQEVEEEISNDTSDKDSKQDTSTSMLESLTDSDLQTLLQNFKHLSTEEQHHLIAHLKKLETADPQRVEKLRKFVNLGDLTDIASTSASAASTSKQPKPKETSTSKAANADSSQSKRYDNSPVAAGNNSKDRDRSNYSDDESNDRRRGINVSNPNKFSLDDEDEDDDYNFDDVFRAASSNVNRLSGDDNSRHSKFDSKSLETSTSSRSGAPKAKEQPVVPVASSPSALTFNPAGLNISLSDTQNLIANLMGSLQQSNANQKTTNLKSTSGSGGQANVPKPVPPISAPQTQQHTQPTHQIHQQQSNMPYFQQQQQQPQQPQQQPFATTAFNQMGNAQAAAYYNTMGGYNNGTVGYSGYQDWGNGQQNMQQFGMQNFITPQQQQQQQQQQQMGYNMYGRGGH